MLAIMQRAGTGTISRAVAMAMAGDTIVLKAGTFRDSVLIDKTLTIRGAGWSKTTIKPPATSTNPCNQAGSMEGLCAVGAFDSLGNPDPTKPVKNVSISRLHLTGFSDGVLGFNTNGLMVNGVRSDHNTEYGIARFVSTHSRFTGNWVSWNGEAGLYMGDSPNAIGIFALNSGGGAPGDLPAGDYKITKNKVWANNMKCPAADGRPGFSGLGIALAGVHDWSSGTNTVTNNSSTQASDLPKGGIVVFSTAFLGGADPTNNTVAGNKVRNNTPADIFWDGTGTGNMVTNNRCMTAIPGNLGWCTK